MGRVRVRVRARARARATVGLGRREHRVSGHGEAGAQHVLGDGTLDLVRVRVRG